MPTEIDTDELRDNTLDSDGDCIRCGQTIYECKCMTAQLYAVFTCEPEYGDYDEN